MGQPLLVSICEDHDPDTKTIVSFVEKSGYDAVIECFDSGEKFLDAVQSGSYHVVFMDIYMDGLSGIETARALRSSDPRVLIVFVTSSRDHALESYRLGALKYIEKPVTEQSVKDSLELALTLRDSGEVLNVRIDKESTDIPADNIYYLEVMGHTCLIHTKDGIMRTQAKLSELCQRLPPHFIRCHRAYAVNMDHVHRIEQDFIMENGDVVYISRKNINQVKKSYLKHISTR